MLFTVFTDSTMPEDGERKGPIAFRMDKPDYKKFIDYVDSTDLSKSKVAERAALAYLDEQDEPPVPRYLAGAILAVVFGMGGLLTLIALPYQITANSQYTDIIFIAAFLVNLAGTVTLATWFVRTYLLD